MQTSSSLVQGASQQILASRRSAQSEHRITSSRQEEHSSADKHSRQQASSQYSQTINSPSFVFREQVSQRADSHILHVHSNLVSCVSRHPVSSPSVGLPVAGFPSSDSSSSPRQVKHHSCFLQPMQRLAIPQSSHNAM